MKSHNNGFFAAAATGGVVIGLAVGFVVNRLTSQYFKTFHFVGWVTDESTFSDAIAWGIGGMMLAMAVAYVTKKAS